MDKELDQIQVEGHFSELSVNTWFTLASRNLYTRRQIIDSKANILLTINSIILSVVLGGLYDQLNNEPHLIWAIGPMLMTNVVAIAFAIFATRPRLRTGKFNAKEIQEGRAALATFDDFYKMSEAEYENAIAKMIQDQSFVYKSLKKDLYLLGIDMSERYKLIHIAYNVFLIGLSVSLLLFGFCHLFY